MKQRLIKSLTMQLCAISAFVVVMASAEIAPAQPHGYIVLHRFHGNDGSAPLAPLAVDSAGNLYGATTGGGDLNCNAPSGCGVVFRLSESGGLDLLHLFTGTPDGASPAAGVVLGAGGLIYGTTQSGGGTCQPSGCGTVYQVGPTGQEKVLYSFAGGPSDGAAPVASLFVDAGNLFGTTANGGIQSVFGTAFELTPSGAETVLHLFAQSPDGAFPGAGFVSDATGNLYSTTALGGSQNGNCAGVGCGTVFALTPAGASSNESVIYSFLGAPDGQQPEGNLVKDASGNLYGVTVGGGSNTNCGSFGCGTVFKLTRAASGWTESVLYNFTGASDGANPRSLVGDSQGNLYGGTTSGGQYSNGTLFALSPTGQFKILHSFTGGPDGARPQVGMVIERPQPIIVGATGGGGNPSCSPGCGVVFAYAQ